MIRIKNPERVGEPWGACGQAEGHWSFAPVEQLATIRSAQDFIARVRETSAWDDSTEDLPGSVELPVEMLSDPGLADAKRVYELLGDVFEHVLESPGHAAFAREIAGVLRDERGRRAIASSPVPVRSAS